MKQRLKRLLSTRFEKLNAQNVEMGLSLEKNSHPKHPCSIGHVFHIEHPYGTVPEGALIY